MKNQRMMIVLIALLVVVALSVGYYRKYHLVQPDSNKPVVSGDTGENDTGNQRPDDVVVLSPDDALQLATEQIDNDNFTVSVSDKSLSKDEDSYYLIDVVNKSGPSFSMQMAINKRSGDIFAYEPATDEMLSMSEFPIVTPIAQKQDWNGVFVPSKDSAATQGLSVELMQADNNQFEFKVLFQNGEDSSFYEIAKIDGSKANYKSDAQYELVFIKNGDKLLITESGEGPLAAKEVKLTGEYELKK